MTMLVVLQDYADGQRQLRAGETIESTQYPISEMRRSGLAAVPFGPGFDEAIRAYLNARQGRGITTSVDCDLTAILLALGLIGGSPGSTERWFVFQEGQPQVGNRYGDWKTMFDAIGALPYGEQPIVCCVSMGGGPIVVPDHRPFWPNGWPMRGGRLTSFYPATGVVSLDLFTNVVQFDMCFGLGQGSDFAGGGLVIGIAPPAGEGVLNFSDLPLGAPRVFTIGGGCAVDHHLTTGAFIRSPGGGTTMVLIAAGCQQNTGLVPPLSGPLLELVGDDGPVAVQIQAFGGLPDNWCVGGGPGSGLLNIHDLMANTNTDNPAVWIPGFTGGAGVVPFNFSRSKFLLYDDALVAPPLGADRVQAALDALKTLTAGDAYAPANPGDWLAPPPTTRAGALDRLGTAVAGLLSGPIP